MACLGALYKLFFYPTHIFLLKTYCLFSKDHTTFTATTLRTSTSETMAQQVSSTAEMIDYFIAFFLPPVGVFLRRGCGADFFINILLCSKCC